MILGLPSGTVSLHRAHDEWARAFEHEAQRIESAIGPYILDVRHIGSTAIKGVPAKPILDLLVGVASYEDAAGCVAPLEELRYEYRGEAGIARRHYFVKGKPRTHHLHMVEKDGPQWTATLAFRDALRSHRELAQEYAAAKGALARRFAHDRDAYQAAKDQVVVALLHSLSQGSGRSSS